ncbi:hypothetical protein [Phaeospirillum tilakii]|uniref:Lipoprotein n=1 Tax=Phaeospirillum tilakii TaxID=741673 RepID=A0ABW5C9B6_9PROT
MAQPKALVLASLVLSACAWHESRPLGTVDPADKVALLPTGTFGLLGALKDELSRRGWTIIVSQGDDRVTGRVLPDADVTISRERKPRYTFKVEQRTWNPCLIGANALRYEVSVIDNASGQEVFLMKGRGDCWFGRNDGGMPAAVDRLEAAVGRRPG